MTTAAHPTFTDAIAGRKRVKADHTAADRLLNRAVTVAVDELRHGSSLPYVASILTTAGNAAALLIDDRTATA